MKHTRHILQILALAVALLAAGQVAQGANKIVKYCITSATTSDMTSYTLTFGLVDGSDTPFDGSTTYGSVTVNTKTATDETITLGGGNFLHGGPVTPDGEHKVPVPGSDPEVKGFPYVLSVDANGVIGFRQYTGTDAIPAGKAYYVQ